MNDGVTLTYLHEYLKDSPHYGVSDCWACSVNAPVSVAPVDYPNWPALLDDLRPVGKSRVWWLNYLNMSRRSEFEQNYALLTHACMSPIGNMRIKEAVPALAGVNAQRLVGVPERLEHYGCPESIFEFPAIGFRDLPNKLRNFGVTYD